LAMATIIEWQSSTLPPLLPLLCLIHLANSSVASSPSAPHACQNPSHRTRRPCSPAHRKHAWPEGRELQLADLWARHSHGSALVALPCHQRSTIPPASSCPKPDLPIDPLL
jgi:hypothetical protein